MSNLIELDYQAIFDASLDACLISVDGKILAANQEAIARYGYSREEFLHMHVSELAAPEFRDKIPFKLNALCSGSEIFEWCHCCKDGSELDVEIHAQPIMFQGAPAILAFIRDLTGRKKLELELGDKSHMLERILDTEPGTVYVYDLIERCNIYINRHWLTAYGYTAEQTRDMGTALLDIFHPDDLARITANHAAWRETTAEETRTIEYRIRDQQGSWHWLLSRETPFVYDENGCVSQILGIAHDINERKHSEMLQAGQAEVLEAIAAGVPLSETLDQLVRLIELLSPGTLGSILLLDEDGVHVRHGAAPNLPPAYVAAINGQPIGPVAGSCGTALYRKQIVIVEDIASDPLWADYKALALSHDLRACWSMPIMDAGGAALGSFAMYHRQPCKPEAQHLQLMADASHVAAIAISHHRSKLALSRSYEQRQKLIDGVSETTFLGLLSTRGEVLEANLSALRAGGLVLEDVLGLPFEDTYWWSYDASVQQQLRAAIERAAQGESSRFDVKVRAFGDQYMYVDFSLHPIVDADGNVEFIVPSGNVIDERKRAEALVNGQKRVFEMIAAGAPLAETLSALLQLIEDLAPEMLGSIMIADKDAVSLRHCAAPSLSSEMIALLDEQAIGPDAGCSGAAAYLKAPVCIDDTSSDPRCDSYREVATRNGLRACWSTPILDVRGQLLGAFAMYFREPRGPSAKHQQLLDDSMQLAAIAIGRHREEQALRTSEKRYRLLFEYAPDGIVVLTADTDAIYLDANARACDMLGYTQDEFIGMRVADIVAPQEVENIALGIAAIKSQPKYVKEWYFKRKDGSTFPTEVIAAEMHDGNILGLIRDISDRKAAEVKMQRLNQLYAALSQCSQATLHCHNEAELFPRICRSAVDHGGLKMAWIGLIDKPSNTVKPVAFYGVGIEYLEGLEIALDPEQVTGKSPTASSIRENQPVWCQDFQQDPKTTAWHERGATFGWGAAAALPIQHKGEVIGALSLYHADKNAFDVAEQNLLNEMVTDISLALNRFSSEKERKQAEAALRLSEQNLRTIIETEPECVKVIDKGGKLLEMNLAGLTMLEADSVEQVRQRGMLNFLLPDYRDAFLDLHQRVMAGENVTLEFEIEGLKGTRRWLETHAAPMRDAKNNIKSMLGITLDITERKHGEERIQYLANYDALTGLPNRTQLNDHLKYAISLAKRNKGKLAVMFIDLDRFKDINDSLGHSIGDAFLIEMSKRLQLCLREEDTAARLGGDEFILMLPNTDTSGVAKVAQKVLEVISVPCRIEAYDLSVTASIGVALYPDDGLDLEALSKNADTAMYRAKQDGRDAYRFFTTEMQASATRGMQLVTALRQALEQNQLHVHYQPQMSLTDGTIIGVEALLRWQHPEMGNVSPAEFIPVAEDSGLILPIGEWVLRTAVQQLKCWLDKGYLPMVMAVNLSAIQFRHPSLSSMVTRILEEEQVPAEYIELELTEGVAMYNPEAAIEVMNTLHELGVRLSIDDFGTGYSSLNYLKKFKVYKLKIDQSFVRDINTNLEDRAIVAAIISMSQNLGLQTIAEGVEVVEQLDYLREQGCNEAQGYYFSKPLAADALEALLVSTPPAQ